MRSLKVVFLLVCAGCVSTGNWRPLLAQLPGETDIGFTTFQRFNGDSLNAGTTWKEGFPIQYPPFHGTLDLGNVEVHQALAAAAAD